MIYDLGHKFDVVTNIRRAAVESDSGWVILEIEGLIDEIERGIAWVIDEGCEVTSLEGDIIAGYRISSNFYVHRLIYEIELPLP